MKPLEISIKGDTGYSENLLHHTDADRLHFYVESIIGHTAWGKARDAMAGVMDKNGNPPTFDEALKAYLDILHEWEYLMLSMPLVMLSAAAAWIWVTNSKRHSQCDR
jgi:hypothetical protein